jgi:hypothetical protein
MSYYGKGGVSDDFVGLALRRRQADDSNVFQIYVSGCSGNFTAGKYNDGSPEARLQLTERIHAGIAAAEKTLKPLPVNSARWLTHEILPPTNPAFDPAKRGTVLRAIDKIDRLGFEGVRALLGPGRKDASGDVTPGFARRATRLVALARRARPRPAQPPPPRPRPGSPRSASG